MMDTKSKATRLSVMDFGAGSQSQEQSGIIFMEGCEFPKAFTFGSPGLLDGIAFGICVRGEVSIKVNSKKYDIDDSTAVVIMPNHIVEPMERSDDLVLRLLVLSLDSVAAVKLDVDTVKMIEDEPCIHIPAHDKEVLSDMFFVVDKLLRSNDYRRNKATVYSMIETIVKMLESVMASNAAYAGQVKVSRAEELTQQFLKMVIVRYKEWRTVDDYADELCVSPKYLTQVVRQTTGETPFEWINKIVIIGAKNLIRTKDTSILQISEELNFPNPSFFSRYFKKHSGMTPLEFRRNG